MKKNKACKYLGLKINRLTFISFCFKFKAKNHWLFICDCGSVLITQIDVVKSGTTKSCGCFRTECNYNKITLYNKSKISLKSIENSKYLEYKNGASGRNILFAINRKYFYNLISLPCHYCGGMPKITNGIDRKDNSVGYIINNCVPYCFICNRSKRELPYDVFIDYINKLTLFNIPKL